jgi:hypothetical protein
MMNKEMIQFLLLCSVRELSSPCEKIFAKMALAALDKKFNLRIPTPSNDVIEQLTEAGFDVTEYDEMCVVSWEKVD